ncbi:hypothetical protein AB833_12230 [Chromatiales bacterium (ex Bugula neritina AB1)]|nr:hypothetical protein AB833_12230 [Chromatiales bacterium (ex Bugula neritina AB1)]
MSLKTCAETDSAMVNRQGILTLLWLRVRQAVRYLSLCVQIRKERTVLSRLTDSELLDIGVNRADAEAECRRTCFDIPSNRIEVDRLPDNNP